MAKKAAPAKKPTPGVVIDREAVADGITGSTKTVFKTNKRKVRDESTKKEESRANHIIERAERMKMARGMYSIRWREYERMWKMVIEERTEDDKWRANLPDTMGFAAVKTAEAAFIDSEVVPVFGKKEGDDLMRANDLRDLYTDVSKKGDQKFQLYLARKDAMKLGTAFLYVIPEKDTRIRWNIDTFNPETDEIEYKREVVDVFKDPKTIRVSPYLVLIDEQARADFRATARDAILIEVIPREEAIIRWAHLVGGKEAFDRRVPTTQQLKSVAVADITNSGVATTANNNTRDITAHKYTFFAPIEIALNMVEVLHYFCVRPEDSYEVLVNSAPMFVKTDTQPSPMPWIHKEIPLVPIRYALYSGDEFWGQGVLEQSWAEARANRQYREMMNDRQRLSLFSPVFIDPTAELDTRLLKLKPLAVIPTRGGVPTQYKVPGITTADLQIAADHGQSLKRATGIDDNMIGGGNVEALGQRRLTATAVAFLRQSLFLRLKDFQFLYKTALIDEVRLKLKLFEQYYSSPVAQAAHLRGEKGLTDLVSQGRQFNVKTGDTYKSKTMPSTLFNGPIEFIDLDDAVLMPLTPAEQIAKWSQVIRDITPFVESGIVDLDLEKALTEYLGALDVNIDKLRKDADEQAIEMADGEHEILINPNTSRPFFDKILKDGTPDQFLTAAHLKRHQQLVRSMGESEEAPDPECLRLLIAHIAKDTKNYEKKMLAQSQKQGSANGLSSKLNDFGAPSQGGGGSAKPPSVSMNYKDAPDDVKRQIEEHAGLSPSSDPAGGDDQQGGKKHGIRLTPNKGAGTTSPDDQPPLVRTAAPGMNG